MPASKAGSPTTSASTSRSGASTVEPALRERAHVRIRAGFRTIADRLEEAGLLRDDAATATATIYAIASKSTYLRMTDGAGLPPDRYAGWLEATLEAVLLT